jgi:hypothetical protein
MRTKLLMSAAAIAVLMAGGVANAQNPNAGGSGGAATNGGAAGASSGASGGASMGSGGAAAPSVRGGADAGGSGAIESHGSQTGGMSAQEENAPKGHPRSAQENKAGQSPGSHTATDSKNSERMNKNTASDSKSGAESKTTGNAATAAKAAPPAAKRTQITSAIKQEKVTAVTNVNFNVSVGARIPASVHFYPVPASVIAIYPEWRGYEFILVGGRYVIVAPETHEIVYILT